MSKTIYKKGACNHCGGHVEFPSEAAGHSVACPHCGQATVLAMRAAETASRPTRARKWIGAGVFGCVVVALALVAFKVWFSRNAPRGMRAQLSSFERAATNRPGAVVGLVENQSGRPRHGVRVEIELLNGRGETLWATTAFAPVMGPNQSWIFHASVIDPNAVTARVAQVRESGR